MYRILRALVCIAVVVGSALVGVSSAYAATLAVCTSGPPVCGFTHIQDAVNAAHPGDTIVILPGTYNENLVVGPSAATPLMLVGQGATVNGGGVGSVLTVVAAHTVTVNGLTLTNGKALATSGSMAVELRTWVGRSRSTTAASRRIQPRSPAATSVEEAAS